MSASREGEPEAPIFLHLIDSLIFENQRELEFVVVNDSPTRLLTGERHGLWRETGGPSVLLDAREPVEAVLYRIEPGESRRFTQTISDPLPEGFYTLVKTINRKSTVGGADGDPLELRLRFYVSAPTDGRPQLAANRA